MCVCVCLGGVTVHQILGCSPAPRLPLLAVTGDGYNRVCVCVCFSKGSGWGKRLGVMMKRLLV